jgi:hypothetical protein
MKTYILTAVIFLSFINTSLFCQTNSENNKQKFSLGAGVGFTTGYGVSFRFTPNKFGVQATFSPMYDDNKTQISAGVSFLYAIMETEKTCFYLYQGNHYNYKKLTYNGYYPTNHVTEFKILNSGIGIGIQFIIFKRVGFDIMAGYAFYDNFQALNLTGEAGLYYKF